MLNESFPPYHPSPVWRRLNSSHSPHEAWGDCHQAPVVVRSSLQVSALEELNLRELRELAAAELLHLMPQRLW